MPGAPAFVLLGSEVAADNDGADVRTNEFMKQVASAGQFSSTTEARQATRATLLTLSEVPASPSA